MNDAPLTIPNQKVNEDEDVQDIESDVSSNKSNSDGESDDDKSMVDSVPDEEKIKVKEEELDGKLKPAWVDEDDNKYSYVLYLIIL